MIIWWWYFVEACVGVVARTQHHGVVRDDESARDALQRVFDHLRPMLEIDIADSGVVRVSGLFFPQPEHRGNPGWLHGGLAATVLDHVCARSASAALEQARVVTAKLDLRYRNPVPLKDGPYVVHGEAEPARGRMVKTSGAILGADGKPLVQANGLFVRLRM